MAIKSYDYDQVLKMVLAFNSEHKYENLLNIILKNMMKITNSDGGTLYIREENMLHFSIIRNTSMGILQKSHDTINLPPIKLDKKNIENVSAYCAIKNETVVIDDVYEDKRFNFSGPKKYDALTGYHSKSMLVLPLTAYLGKSEEVLGVIQLINAIDPHTGEVIPYRDVFEPPLIPALANIAANTLNNLIHISEVRSLLRSFVSAMVKAIDERSKYNSNHTHKVTRLCTAFAEHLNVNFPEGHPFHFDETNIEEITMAAMLHDIGKITTPLEVMDKSTRLADRLQIVLPLFDIKLLQVENDMLKGLISPKEHAEEHTRILNARRLTETASSAGYINDEMYAEVQKLADITYKDAEGNESPILSKADMESLSVRKGTLTQAERELMQEHVNVTARILKNIAFKKHFKNVPKWAESHHEFLDGTGYPLGLTDLPTEVCIITIMDIFEALTADDRPYKAAMPTEKALSILTEMATEGKLHAELVELFKNSNVWQIVE